MKLQLSITCKDLPSPARYQAQVCDSSASDGVIGQTDVCSEETTDPMWNKLVVIDFEASPSVTIKVMSGDNVIATSTFDVSTILASPQKALAQRSAEEGDGGALICVHAEEPQMGQLQVVFGANDLPDTDFGLISLVQRERTDPMFDVYASNGMKLYRSQVIDDELNPTWEPTLLDIDRLCGGNMDATVRIVVMDKDTGSAAEDLGEVKLTVNEMLQAPKSFRLTMRCLSNKGTFLVKEAQLMSQELVSRQAKKILEAVASALKGALQGLEEMEKHVAEKVAAATAALEAAASAKKEATSKEEAADAIGLKRVGLFQGLEKLNSAVASAAEAAKATPCSGKIRFKLAAQDLPDVDGWFNLTDGFYEIFKPDTADRFYRSNIVRDNLNPTWDEATLDLVELCNGDLDAQMRITVSDMDKGEKTEYLGYVQKSVNDLIHSKMGDSTKIEDQPKGAAASLVVVYAELVDHVDFKKKAEELQRELETTKAELDAIFQTWKTAQEEAEAARQNAAEATKAAELAQDEAEAAKLALEMAKTTV